MWLIRETVVISTHICLLLNIVPYLLHIPVGLPCSSNGKESACNAGELCSIPGSGRSPGEGNGNPFQYSCLGNLMDRRTWQAFVHGVHKESDMTEQLPVSPTHTTYIGMHMYCLENFLALIYRPLIPTLLLANLKIEIWVYKRKSNLTLYV